MSAPIAVDIIIPVYNEGKNIGTAIQRIAESVKIPFHLHLVYDLDEDDTLSPARAASEKYGIKLNLIKNKFGRGALNAMKTGISSTTSEFVVITMADLSDPPEVINSMYDTALSTQADVVCGSRYMRGGSQMGGPLVKRTLSKWAGLSLHYLARIPTHDATNSFKLYRRKLFDHIQIESNGGFELGLEMVVKAHNRGFSVREVPTSWHDRSEGESRFKLVAWLPSYLKWYFHAFGRLPIKRAD